MNIIHDLDGLFGPNTFFKSLSILYVTDERIHPHLNYSVHR